MRVSFTGLNIDKSIRKVIAFSRAVLQRPRLMMMYEEGIAWGATIRETLETFKKRSPDSTVISITRSNRDVLNYDNAVLIDGGMVIDQGDPVQHMV